MRGRSTAPLLLFAALCAGCGGGGGTTTVEGTVTLGGVPIPDGQVTFVYEDGKTPQVQVPIKDGKFSGKVSTGAAKVQINYPKVTGKRESYGPGSPKIDVYTEQVPERYNTNTELKADIKAGDNPPFKWDLKSK